MIDLFMTAVGIFGIFLLPFLMIRYLKIFNLILLFVTFILALVLLSTSENYEELDLWENSVYNPICKTNFLPIKRIKAFKLPDGEYDFDLIKTDGIFSIVKNDEYSKECLENYFIRSTNECPITDLKFKKGLSQSHIFTDYDEQQIDDGLYLYTNNNKFSGCLYSGLSIYSVPADKIVCYMSNQIKKDDKCYEIINPDFNYINISDIVYLEKDKISNPFKGLKNYAKVCDKIYLSLIIMSFIYTFYEPYGARIFNYFKIINLVIQFIIFILLCIRYDKYRKIKNYLKDNKREYEDVLPKLAFNFDTISISFSIAYIIYYILYIISPPQCHCIKLCCQCLKNLINPDSDADNINEKYSNWLSDMKRRIFVLILPVYICLITIMLYDILNDDLIMENYDIINYNSQLNSIESISVSQSSDSSDNKFKWKNVYIEYNTNEYNYYDISEKSNDNSKVCGKDVLGNDLYFPNDVECPINDIFITKYDWNEFNDYTKVKLSDEAGYLFYTNKKTTEKIIATLIIKGTNDEDNDEDDDEDNDEDDDEDNDNDKKRKKILKSLNSPFFYNELDTSNECESCEEKNSLKLYAVYYIGVNNTLADKLKDFKENLDNYDISLLGAKYTGFLSILFFIIFSCLLLFRKFSCCSFVFFIIFVVILIFFIITNILCLSTNIKYVKKYMNKINFYFEENNCDSIWPILLVIIGIILLYFYIFMFVYKIYKRNEDDVSGNNTQFNQGATNEVVVRYDQNQGRNSNDPVRVYEPNEERYSNDPVREFPQVRREAQVEEEESNDDDNNNEGVDPDHICVICMTRPTKVILCPCGHKCVCKMCFKDLNSRNPKRCPICRKEFIGKINRVFSVYQ